MIVNVIKNIYFLNNLILLFYPYVKFENNDKIKLFYIYNDTICIGTYFFHMLIIFYYVKK